MIGEMIACFFFGLFAGALVGYIWNTIPYTSGHIDGYRAGWKAAKEGKECI